ncbi:MAG TPA: peptidoglycan-binding protein [Pyrinomonadaceae bacterium]|nr:peptidoglycan-binding protein [Pyrinomonadaceae bacterium]
MKTRLSKLILLVAVLIASFAFIAFGSVPDSADSLADPGKYSDDWRANGPPGGDVRSLVVDPNNADRFYLGTLDAQLYTSADAGKNWELLYNFNKPKLFVDHIIVDPRDSKTLYVAAHRHKEAGGFFKSVDGGHKWRESPELKNEALHSLTQADSNPSVLIAGTFNGIFRSDNSGDSWTQLPTYNTPGLVHVESLAIDPRTTSTIYAGTWYLPYKSTDGGQSWKTIKNGIIDDSDIFAIDIDPRDPNHVIASACSGIYETGNAGDSWTKVQGIPSQSRRTRAIVQHPSIPGLVFAGTTEGFWRSERGGKADSWMVTTSRQLEVNSIAIHPSRPQTIYIGTNNYGVMVSTDGGKNFIPTNGGYSGRFANVIVADRETPNRIYAATINTTTGGGFLFVSADNGETWRPSMRSMPNRLITYSILQDARDANLIYLGTNLGVYRSLDRGASWAPASMPIQPATPPKARPGKKATTPPAATMQKAAPKPPSETARRVQQALNAAGYSVGVPDGRAGKQTIAALKKYQADRHLPVSGKIDDVTLKSLGLPPGLGDDLVSLSDAVNALVQTIDVETQSPVLLAATNVGLYRSLDPVMGWEKLSYGVNLDTRTSCVWADPQQPETILVGTAASGVLISRDAGKTWQQVSGIPSEAPVNTIARDLQRPNNIYVGTKQSFYLSRDGGVNWSRRGGNLPFGDFTSILINPRNSEEVFVGNAYQTGEIGGGVFRTINGGQTWARIDPKENRLPSQRIWALAFDSRDQNTLFVGSHSAGVYVVPRGPNVSAVNR